MAAPLWSSCSAPTLRGIWTRNWHAFWGEGADVLIGEVSTVNDDETDNVFHEPLARFSEIEADAEPARLLVSDYVDHFRR